MAKVLVLHSSISPADKSYSGELMNRFIKHYKEKDANAEIIMMDLTKEPMAQQSLSASTNADFFNEENALKYIRQLKEVDKLVIASPMHNFNVPGVLKNYLDHVLLANETFSYKYSKKGDAKGLLTNLTVQILTTQGAPYGWYLWGNHTEYLRGTMEFAGAKVNEPILVAGTKVAPTSEMTPSELIDTYEDKIKKAAEIF